MIFSKVGSDWSVLSPSLSLTETAEIAETVLSSIGIDGIVSDAVGTDTISEMSFQNATSHAMKNPGI